MASLRRLPDSPFWIGCYTLPDGRRTQRSTKTTDKRQALQVCHAWAKASALGDRLTADKAREVIAAGVADVMLAGGQTLPSASVRDWCKRWLESKAVETEDRTHERYATCLRRFVEFMGDKADRDLATISADDVLRFRDDTAKRLSVTSTNMDLKVLRGCLGDAVRQDLIEKNVAASVKVLKQPGQGTRRPFTLEEIRRMLERCGESGGEWRGLVLTALYTGQRLGDVARLTWQQVDLGKREISFVTAKTGKRLCMSLAKPLADHLEGLPSADDPHTFVFPHSAEAAEKRTGTISTRFYDEILAPAGLVPVRPRKDKSAGIGRDGRRAQSVISFHSFRHTLTTWLKSAGASNALAQMIIGHDSPTVSGHYTHLGAGDSRESIDRLPDVTKAADSAKPE